MTPPTRFVAAPHWRSVTPFTMHSPEQFRVGPPPTLASTAYTLDFNEVKATGSKAANALRSKDQTQYAANLVGLASMERLFGAAGVAPIAPDFIGTPR